MILIFPIKPTIALLSFTKVTRLFYVCFALKTTQKSPQTPPNITTSTLSIIEFMLNTGSYRNLTLKYYS
jgi:hypothetical protein